MKKSVAIARKFPVRARVVIFGIPLMAWLAILQTLYSFSRIWDVQAPTIQESFVSWMATAKMLFDVVITGKEVE